MSSAKNTIKGIVAEVGDIDFIGAKQDFPKQRIVIFKPAYVDEFGTKRGKDDYFAFDVLGNTVETLNITEHFLNRKVECEVYFSGNKFTKQDGTEGYAINANLSKITDLGAYNAPAAAPATNNRPVDVADTDGDDDLPF